MRMRHPLTLTLALALGLALALALDPPPASPYPLDGQARTGIRRLEGYRLAQADPGRRVAKLAPGALLPTDAIQLSLHGLAQDWDLATAPKDPALQAALEGFLRDRDPSYAVAVVDLTDPQKIAWAGLREDLQYVPESVGKVVVLAGLFDALARAFPDPAARERVLRETVVEATDWAMSDSHKVPHFDPATGRNRYAPIARGERFVLAEWIDHMVSASANSAGSTVWKEAILLRRFGAAYPPGREQEELFFKSTPRTELRDLALKTLEEPLQAAGLDTSALRQGTMYTRGGQARIPGSSSTASPRELARYLLRLEQGRLVDAWSSLEMKHYLYFTKKRYRYAYAPELKDAAVYFKSGSHYKCAPEPDFKCGKYRGNVENLMNSIAIVESPAARGPEQKRYIVALMSDVKRKNSAWDHSRLAAAIEEAVRTRKPPEVKEAGSAAEVQEAGAAQ
jgi:hypothetical protein